MAVSAIELRPLIWHSGWIMDPPSKSLGIRYLFQDLSKIGVQGVLHDSPYLSS